MEDIYEALRDVEILIANTPLEQRRDLEARRRRLSEHLVRLQNYESSVSHIKAERSVANLAEYVPRIEQNVALKYDIANIQAQNRMDMISSIGTRIEKSLNDVDEKVPMIPKASTHLLPSSLPTAPTGELSMDRDLGED